jgi:tetratricopeptide (TPR) repeat protein
MLRQRIKKTNILQNKDNALFDLGKHEDSIQYYDKVLAVDPNHIQAQEYKKSALEGPSKTKLPLRKDFFVS